MNIQDNINRLVQFREHIYRSFSHRSDSLMDLLDALCGNEGASAVVELSLNRLFRREYSALYAAIDALGESALEEFPLSSLASSSFPSAWIEAIANLVPAPQHRHYWLFGVDVTPVCRDHALTLKDRECVYQPTLIAGNQPIGLGHNYSLMAAIPEAQVAGGRSWLVPLLQPMHTHPFSLLQVQVSDSTGKRVFAPQWLIVFGQSRQQLSSREADQAYLERFNLEHGIRFSKQHLLMTQLQTPEVKTEEHWVQLVILAYAQLWAARNLTHLLPMPWQRYLPTFQQAHNSPSLVQRDFSRIIRSIGTPAKSVKARGKSPGRRKGFTLDPRPKRPLVKRGRPRRKKHKKAA